MIQALRRMSIGLLQEGYHPALRIRLSNHPTIVPTGALAAAPPINQDRSIKSTKSFVGRQLISAGNNKRPMIAPIKAHRNAALDALLSFPAQRLNAGTSPPRPRERNPNGRFPS